MGVRKPFSMLVAFIICAFVLFTAPTVVSGSDLFWSFCYFGSDLSTGWRVVISGSFLSGPLDTSTTIYTYPMLSAMGVRSEYDASGKLVSSVDVIGVAIKNSSVSQNDNLVQTQWPVLTAYGVSFLLDDYITVPGVSPGYVTNVSSISGEPPVEYPYVAETSTYSYFLFQSANTDTALECPAPPPTQYAYYYTASEKHTNDRYSLGSNLSLWSSCGSGRISLTGPYSFPSQYSLAGRTVYVVADVIGERVFTNGSYVQRVNVSGVNSLDGGDYIFYVDNPFVDNAGITMGTSTEPAFDTGTFAGQSYINWWTPDGYTMYEAVMANTADNVMQFSITPYIEGETLPSCPDTIQSTLFYYCYYADNGGFEVTMTGRLITNALNVTNGSYWVTAIDGVRTQLSAQSVQVSDAYDMTWRQDANGQHNNLLFQTEPYFDSYLGLTLNLGVNSQQGSRELTLLGSPPREQWSTVVNDTLMASKAPVHSYFVYQTGSAPSCPMKANRTALLQHWSFQYVIRAPNMAWSITCVGSLSVLGPYRQSLAPSRLMYVVVNATGTRSYTDSDGQDHISQIVGLANATLTSASQLLYATLTAGSFVPDAAGIAMLLSSTSFFPDQPSSNLLRLSSADGQDSIRETPCSANRSAVNASTFASEQGAVSLAIDTSSPIWTAGSFTVNGDSVRLQTGKGAIWFLAAVVTVLAMHSVFAVQRVALKMQSRVAQSHPWKVTGAVLFASAIFGICGVFAAELLLASTIQLDCPECVYQFELRVRQSNVLYALLPSLLLSIPSWWLLSTAAVIVRIRKSNRITDTAANRRKETTITSGTLQSKAAPSKLVKSAIAQSTDSVVDNVVDSLNLLRSNLCWLTFVIGLPIAAAIIATRVTLEYGVSGPVDVSPMALSNILMAALDCVLLWLLVAMHLSGLMWRCVASVGLPLVILFDFYCGSLSRSVLWDSGNSSMSATSLESSTCWWIGGLLVVVSVAVGAADITWRLNRRRKMLENRVINGENKLEWTRKELDSQVTMLRQLRAMYDEAVRQSDLISLARPATSAGTILQSLLSLDPPLDALEKSGERCAGHQPLLSAAMTAFHGLGTDSRSSTPNPLDPLARIKAMSARTSTGGSMSGSQRAAAVAPNMGATMSLNSVVDSTKDSGTNGTDEVGEMLQDDEPLDPATQALIALLEADIQSRDSISANPARPTSPNNPASSPGAVLRRVQSALPDEWRPPAGFRPSLLDIISHPACLEMLKDSMQEQHCIENVMFVCRARRWAEPSTQKQHPQLRTLLAEQIARDFIQPDASNAINIDHASRTALLRRIKDRSLNPTLFNDAEAEVRKLIAVNNWNSFTHSPSYTLCCLLLWRNTSVMRAINKLGQQPTSGKGKTGSTHGVTSTSSMQHRTVSRSGAAT